MDHSAKPNIVSFSTAGQAASEIKKNPLEWLKKNPVKIIVFILVVAVAAELLIGGASLFSPASSGVIPQVTNINSLTDARLSLIADKTSYSENDQVVVDVRLFTGGYTTDSVDLVVKFDPAFLQPEEKFADTGNIYSEYPAVQVDRKLGLVGISGITVPGSKSFLGSGSFAKLYFKALKQGQTQVNIDFEKDATSDSNVVISKGTEDILGNVTDANIIIAQPSAESAPETSVQSCTSFTQYCQDSDGQLGTQVCTGGVQESGVCSYDPRSTVSCEVCNIK